MTLDAVVVHPGLEPLHVEDHRVELDRVERARRGHRPKRERRIASVGDAGAMSEQARQVVQAHRTPGVPADRPATRQDLGQRRAEPLGRPRQPHTEGRRVALVRGRLGHDVERLRQQAGVGRLAPLMVELPEVAPRLDGVHRGARRPPCPDAGPEPGEQARHQQGPPAELPLRPCGTTPCREGGVWWRVRRPGPKQPAADAPDQHAPMERHVRARDRHGQVRRVLVPREPVQVQGGGDEPGQEGEHQDDQQPQAYDYPEPPPQHGATSRRCHSRASTQRQYIERPTRRPARRAGRSPSGPPSTGEYLTGRCPGALWRATSRRTQLQTKAAISGVAAMIDGRAASATLPAAGEAHWLPHRRRNPWSPPPAYRDTVTRNGTPTPTGLSPSNMHRHDRSCVDRNRCRSARCP